MLIDLQLHSKYSDGYSTIGELVRMLNHYQIKVASLTDHNSITGQAEFIKTCQSKRIKAIPGLELYVKYKKRRLNILWYNYPLDSPELSSLLEGTIKRRKRIMFQATKRLLRQGFEFDFSQYQESHQGYLPINHFVDFLRTSPKNCQIIKRDLGLDNPREEEVIGHYFYPRSGLRLKEAYVGLDRILKLRKKIGGQLIIAHPFLNVNLTRDLLIDLLNKGIDGLEMLSPHHSYNNTVLMASWSKEFGFIATGGSDFHRPGEVGAPPRFSWEWFKISSRHLRKVNKIIG